MGGKNKPPGITEGGDITKTNGGGNKKKSGWSIGVNFIDNTSGRTTSILYSGCTCGFCIFCKERQKNKPK